MLIIDFHRELTRYLHRELSAWYVWNGGYARVKIPVSFPRCWPDWRCCFEVEAFVPGLKDMAVVSEAVEQHNSHLGSPNTKAHSEKYGLVVMITLERP